MGQKFNVKQVLKNLTNAARQGRLSPVVGRGEVIEQTLEILAQTRKANVLLIGPAGAGKTAIAEGLAILSAKYPERLPPSLSGMEVLELDRTALIAGTGIMGEHEERLEALFQGLSSKSVLFIDEVHTLFGAGGREGKTDTAQNLKAHLARDDFKIIAATTTEEYTRVLAQDSAFSRRFHIVYISPLSMAATVEALAAYAEFRDVPVNRRLLKEIARRAQITCPTRALPDPAIDLFERASVIASWGETKFNAHVIDKATARIAGLPADILDKLRRKTRDKSDTLMAAAASALANMLQAKTAPPLAIECDAARAKPLAEKLGQLLGQGTLEVNGLKTDREIYGAEPGYIGFDNRLAIHGLLETPFRVVCVSNLPLEKSRPRLTEDVRRGWFEDNQGKRIPITVAVLEKQVDTRRIGF